MVATLIHKHTHTVVDPGYTKKKTLIFKIHRLRSSEHRGKEWTGWEQKVQKLEKKLL
jgi:hypothetical protein